MENFLKKAKAIGNSIYFWFQNISNEFRLVKPGLQKCLKQIIAYYKQHWLEPRRNSFFQCLIVGIWLIISEKGLSLEFLSVTST